MSENGSEYLDYVQTSATSDSLSQLQQLAEKQAEANAEVARLEAELTKARERYKDLSERQVPELMDSIGMAEFKTATGLVIKIDETIRAAIPNAKALLAFAWLTSHGNEALIKRNISLGFSKGENEKADALLNELMEKGYEPDDKSSVHPSTLSSFVREKLAKGEDIPLDLFGVHRQRIAKISI
jgi:hypothetical protein